MQSRRVFCCYRCSMLGQKLWKPCPHHRCLRAGMCWNCLRKPGHSLCIVHRYRPSQHSEESLYWKWWWWCCCLGPRLLRYLDWSKPHKGWSDLPLQCHPCLWHRKTKERQRVASIDCIENYLIPSTRTWSSPHRSKAANNNPRLAFMINLIVRIMMNFIFLDYEKSCQGESVDIFN